MKKLLIVIAIVLASATLSFAESKNTTRIGSAHDVDFGLYYGYSQGALHNYGSALIDFNAAKSNLRTRLQIGGCQRWYWPMAAVDVQYLFPLVGGLYLYPFLGVEGEYHDAKKLDNWKNNYDICPEGGLGLEYQFTSNFGLFLQGRYQYQLIDKRSRLSGNVGIVFNFGKGKRALAEEALAQAEAEAAAKAAAEKAAAEKAAAEKAAAEAAARAAAEKAAAEKAAAEAAAAARAAARATSENVLFLLDKYEIRDCEVYKIDNIAKIMKDYPEATLTVSGYADKETGKPKHNMELSKNRAEVVTEALIAAGVDPSRITTEYYGDEVNPFPTPEENRVAVCVTK